MKIAVIYKSKTGFTKKYAEMVAEEIDCTLMEFKKATVEIMSDFDVIVFGGRVCAGMVDGMNKAKEMFEGSKAEKFAVFATGGTPNEAEEVIEEFWENNLSEDELESIPHFYMQGGICYEKMPLFEKMIMKMMAHVMKNKKNKDDADAEFAKRIQSSYDISSKEYAEPLIQYLKKNAWN